MPLYDLHTHTENSLDSHQPIAGLCHAAVEHGLAGIAVTDHSDTPFIRSTNLPQRLLHCMDQIEEMALQYGEALEILRGIELGEQIWAKNEAQEVLQLAEYDVVLGSQHGFLREGNVIYYSAENFDGAHYTDRQLDAFLRRYLENELETAQTGDYDILTHLDCPMRYINGKYRRNRDILLHADLIEQILQTVILRNKTLEVNTSGLSGACGTRMPQDAILRRYVELGGNKISIGSDAHICTGVAVGFEQTVALIQQYGITGQTVYRRRKPIFVPFD